MNPISLLYLSPLLIAVIISLATSIVVWQRQVESGKAYFAFLMLALGIWAFIYLLEVASGTPAMKVFFSAAKYVGITPVPVLWLAFALDYTQNKDWLTRRNLLALCVVPFLTLLFALTNDLHGLMWENATFRTNGYISWINNDFHVWFWVHSAYSYLLLILGSLLLFNAMIRSPRIYRNQRIVLLASLFFPWLANALTIFGLSPFAGLDLTTFAFSLTGLTMLWGMLRFQLMDLVPVAHQAIIENMRDGVIVLDTQSRIVDLNLAAQQIINRSASQAIGKPAVQVLSDWQDIVERYTGVTEANTEIELNTPQAQTIYDLRISPLLDRRDRSLGRMIVLHDITQRKRAVDALRQLNEDLEARVSTRTEALARELAERKQAEQALAESEESFRAAFENTLVGMVFTSTAGKLLRVNDAFCQMLGYSKVELQQVEFGTLTHPDDRTMSYANLQLLLRGEQRTCQFEKRYLHKNGQIVWTAIGVSIVRDVNGNPHHFVTYTQDITDRKLAEQALAESEKKYHELFQVNRDGIAVFLVNPYGPPSTFVEVNNAAPRMLGYTREEMLKLTPPMLEPQGSQAEFITRRAEMESKGIANYETVLTGKDGYQVSAEFSAQPILYEGKPAVMSIVRDITQRKKAEAQILLHSERLATLNRIARALGTTLNLDELLEIVYRQITAVIPSDEFSVALYDRTTAELDYRIRVICGVRKPVQQRHLVSSLTESIITNKQPLLVRDYEQEKAHLPQLKNWATQQPLPTSWLGVPMLHGDSVVGVISLKAYQPNAFDDEELELLSTIADTVAVAIENAQLFDSAQRRLNHTEALHAIDTAISGNLDLHGTLRVLLEQVMQQLHVDAADVLLLNPNTQLFDYGEGLGFRTPALLHTHLRLGDGLAGRAALERKTLAIPDLNRNIDGLARSPFIQDEGFETYYGVPLMVKGRVNGVLEIFHRTPLQPDSEWVGFLETLAGQAAIAIDHATLFGDLQDANARLGLAYDTTLEGWSSALELREQETAGHSQRVVALTLRFAREFGFAGEQLQPLRRGALLHDIGKMGVPDSVLLKPGPLTAEEWALMRQHPSFAYRLLCDITYLQTSLDIPYCHHEKWDGTGYPQGLSGEQIPLPARIFAIVDVWDALTSDRPYRKAWTGEHARKYIQEQAGKHFDPQVVTAFLQILECKMSDA